MAADKAEVWFYQLERTGLEETLPGLLEKVVEKGWRAVVRASTDARLDSLDGRLWTYKDESFLAHSRAGRGHEADQPIYLTTGTENPNGADALIVVDGAEFTELAADTADAYARTMILFSGKDAEALNQARDMWKEAKAKGLTISYWEQGASGGWEKRA